ncbi:MAG: ArsR family transcriptional regulator [Candidatus Aenigmarchaeota archaeon]|nr:ArsR family transcriptional regulator [Candidatus Aenigmarchaeota archaeon]NIP41035.1 ArsR family transcriptional regulator [Candidatus Aenigmarchaeota archaeon]NIQ17437.1 ArsR family transcriptional regulator [Candidatus Aenigmarchaeota archaeon]NIS73631.1 ArsR family transcriptional regulator [Candidatus Aenigmarchaeota archaeon]
MEEIHINDFPAGNITVLLKDDFLERILAEIKKKRLNMPNLHRKLNSSIPLSSFESIMMRNYPNFRHLWILLGLCEELKIPYKDLEKNISSYRTKKSRNPIVKPKIPIFVTPIFDMLIAHFMADGHCFHILGRDPYFVYVKYDKYLRLNFLKKLEAVFGEIEYSKKYYLERDRIHIPSSISSILMKRFDLNPKDFLEKNARIPQKMLRHEKEHILAILIAFIIDEGNIDSSQISIPIQNKDLLLDLKFICDKLGYENVFRDYGKRKCLYILSKGTKKFWKDYKKLKEKYPEVDMGYKERILLDFIIRKGKKWRTSRQGENKNKIIELLKESPRTVIEISKILQISRQGTKHHLKQLNEKGIVKIDGIGYAGSHIYVLKKYNKFPVKRKGISRQKDVTKNNVLKVLEKRNLTTRQISNTLDINMGTIFQFLVKLEKKGKIRRIGKKKKPVTWSLI